MPLPNGVELVTVSSGQPLTLPDGTWLEGTLTFTGPNLVTIGAHDVVLGGPVTARLANGQFSVRLVATDATGMSPTGWTYRVDAKFTNGAGWTRYLTLPKASPSVQLADVLVPDPVAGAYTVLVDPSSIDGATASDTVVSETTFGQSPSAGTSAAFARGDHTHGTPPAPSGGGGAGSTIRTATVRVTDDNLSGLPAAAAWTVVQTSGGTKLQAAIAAAAGDRIRVCANFLYVGSHFLDWALLDTAGNPALYAASGTSSPMGEGDPPLYPILTLSKDPSPEMFTVGAGHIDGTGKATIALMHQGTGTGSGNLVYAHPTYPWRLRLENIGPEPS
ncbi:hypothetical protein ACFY2J_34260 [Streptomyces collinus]|uniref:hypothetical protein n=1 Tax=Streptomyces collinus TaxID=42684 RepID=UPI0036CFFA31